MNKVLLGHALACHSLSASGVAPAWRLLGEDGARVVGIEQEAGASKAGGLPSRSLATSINMIIDGIYLPVDESCVFDGFEGGGFFRVQAGDDIYAVITPDGHLGTHGQVYSQLDADLDTVPGQCVRFKNAEDETVAVITAENFNDSNVNPVSPHLVEAGSFLLKGKFFHGANPDRSEGHFIVCDE